MLRMLHEFSKRLHHAEIGDWLPMMNVRTAHRVRRSFYLRDPRPLFERLSPIANASRTAMLSITGSELLRSTSERARHD
ncbi:MAG: hypothetical protein WKF31_13210 [Thermoleophilaceae bacterium]